MISRILFSFCAYRKKTDSQIFYISRQISKKGAKKYYKGPAIILFLCVNLFSAFEVSSQPLFQTKGLCCKLGEGGCDATTTL